MIIAEQITKKYGKLLANDHVSLQVKEGELAILLGPNGAGKSTLIKSVCGLLRFNGNITIGGFENHSLEAKRILGYVPELPALILAPGLIRALIVGFSIDWAEKIEIKPIFSVRDQMLTMIFME